MTHIHSRRLLNPYDFVPLEDAPTYVARPDHSKFHGQSGQITFSLEVLTPLCINHDPGRPDQQGVYAFAHVNGLPTLPATSLKGMLRGVHEIVTNSRFSVLKQDWYRSRMPASYLPSQHGERLSSTEALFGMVGGKGDDSVGHAGLLLIDDLVIPPSGLESLDIWRPARGGMPKPTHESFYFAPGRNGAALGRKRYYHQDYRRVKEIYSGERSRASEARTIQVVSAGARLSGSLRFFNLTEHDLAGLIYTLVLEDDLAHKLGYGKPLGLGSVRIRIDRLVVEQDQDGLPLRLLSYDDEPQFVDRTAAVETLRQAAKDAWLSRPQGRQSYAAFAHISRWQTHQLYIYPDYGFFQDERHRPSKIPLWEYQGRTELHPGAAASQQRAATPPPATRSLSVAPSSPLSSPPTAIDLRPVGLITLGGSGSGSEPYIEGIDGKRYRLRKESAPLDVLRPLLARLRAGERVRVRYRPDRLRVDGKNVNVAHDVEPVEEDQS